MNTVSKALLFGLSIGLFHSAYADSFNERGEDWLQQVSPSKRTTAHQGDYSKVSSLGFSEKGEDWIVAESSDNGSIQSPLKQIIVLSLGFNDRSHVEESGRNDYADQIVGVASN